MVSDLTLLHDDRRTFQTVGNHNLYNKVQGIIFDTV